MILHNSLHYLTTIMKLMTPFCYSLSQTLETFSQLMPFRSMFLFNATYDFRSSRPEVFCKKGILKISQNLQENACATVSFEACTLIKKENLAQVFSCEYCEILRRPFYVEHLPWLLLRLQKTSDFLIFSWGIEWKH